MAKTRNKTTLTWLGTITALAIFLITVVGIIVAGGRKLQIVDTLAANADANAKQQNHKWEKQAIVDDQQNATYNLLQQRLITLQISQDRTEERLRSVQERTNDQLEGIDKQLARMEKMMEKSP